MACGVINDMQDGWTAGPSGISLTKILNHRTPKLLKHLLPRFQRQRLPQPNQFETRPAPSQRRRQHQQTRCNLADVLKLKSKKAVWKASSKSLSKMNSSRQNGLWILAAMLIFGTLTGGC